MAEDGDLYIFISIVSHELFDRDGTNIFCNVPISIMKPHSEALLRFQLFLEEEQKLKSQPAHKVEIS